MLKFWPLKKLIYWMSRLNLMSALLFFLLFSCFFRNLLVDKFSDQECKSNQNKSEFSLYSSLSRRFFYLWCNRKFFSMCIVRIVTDIQIKCNVILCKCGWTLIALQIAIVLDRQIEGHRGWNAEEERHLIGMILSIILPV